MFVVNPRQPALYAEARQLSEDGEPFKRIAAALGISVATAHSWTRDIELTPGQIQRNLTGPRGPQSPEFIAHRTEAIRRVYRERRLQYQRAGRLRAQSGDPMHQAGCMLYWAEGSKDRNTLCFANSDAGMLVYFCRFLRECLSVAPADMTLRVNAYTGNEMTMSEIEGWWLDLLGLPPAALRRGVENHRPTSSSGRKVNKLPLGVCTLRVKKSTHLVQHIYGAIQEYGGFDEPAWLDGPTRKPPAVDA